MQNDEVSIKTRLVCGDVTFPPAAEHSGDKARVQISYLVWPLRVVCARQKGCRAVGWVAEGIKESF